MKNTTTRLLLIEDDPSVAAIINDVLAASGYDTYGSFHLVWEPTLDGALRQLTGETEPTDAINAPDATAGIDGANDLPYSAVLLGLTHTDHCDIEAFDRIATAAPELPVLLLGDFDDPVLERHALRRGAQAYLPRALLRSGNINWLFHTLHNAIERKLLIRSLNQTEAELQTERQRFRAVLASASDGIISLDAAGRVMHMNAVAEKLSGWPLHEALDRPLSDIYHTVDGKTRQPVESTLDKTLRENRASGFGTSAILLHRDSGEFSIEDALTQFRDASGQTTGALLVFRDVGDTQGMAMKMAYLAQHDALTGLPNRSLMHDRLAQAITLAGRHSRKAALLYMDVDRFKNINDSLGHPIGDKLLQVIADRLLTCVRYSDTVSRQGGDEFVILLTEIEQSHDAAICAEKILSALSRPIAIDSHQIYITSSIGISLYPDDGKDSEALIRSADLAMYHAKAGGRANFQFFRQTMNQRLVQRQSLEDALRNALKKRQFILHYQPKIDLENGAITGAEALVRWNHPERGLISPALFVPIAEECGLMQQIGQWVLREACRQMQDWQNAGLNVRRVAVNISAPEFRSRNFISDVRDALTETGMSAERLEIELKEAALMADLENAQSRLSELKKLGVNIAIDDFGTGHSSLRQLKRFPIDSLKIDRSFVQSMTKDPADAAIVSAVIGMGKSLNYRVVAEGVETREQHLFLQANLCDESQGHHFSRPLNAAGFTALMAHHPVHSAELH